MNGLETMLSSGLAFAIALVASVACVALLGIRIAVDKGVYAGMLIGVTTYLYGTFVWEMPESLISAILIVVASYLGWQLYSGGMLAWRKRLEISAVEARLGEPVDTGALLEEPHSPTTALAQEEELPAIVLKVEDIQAVRPYEKYRW